MKAYGLKDQQGLFMIWIKGIKWISIEARIIRTDIMIRYKTKCVNGTWQKDQGP